MQVLILGGSGRTGRLVVREALAAGHGVTVLVRSAARFRQALLLSTSTSDFNTPPPNLTVIEGTPLRPQDIRTALSAAGTARAVLIALNARRTSDSPFASRSPDTPERMMADSARNAIDGLVASSSSPSSSEHPPRVVILSSAGAGSSFARMNPLLRAMFAWTNMRLQLADHDAVDAETRLRGGDVDWILVRPFMLVDDDGEEGQGRKLRVWGDDGQGAPFMPRSSRAAVARFMVEALEGDEFVGRSPVVTN